MPHRSATSLVDLAARVAARVAGACLVSLAGLAQAAPAWPPVVATYHSMESPYAADALFHTDQSALFQFLTAAQLDHGLTVAAVDLATAPLGSFLGGAGLTLGLGNGGGTVTLTSNATQRAVVKTGPDPFAFSAAGPGQRYVEVGAFGGGTDAELLTMSFSRPITGFAFWGAGLSDYAGYPASAATPSQRVSLDAGVSIAVLGVDPRTVASPSQMSFGVLTGAPFQTVTLLMPAGSDNDNAALGAIWVAFDPAAPVPEPGQWMLLLCGAGVVGLVARRRQDQGNSRCSLMARPSSITASA